MDFVDFENLLYQEHWAKVDLFMYTVTVVLGGFIHLLLFVLNSFILLRSGKYLFVQRHLLFSVFITCIAKGESRSRSAVTPSVRLSVHPKILSSQLL